VAYFGVLALIGFWPSPVDETAQDLLSTVLFWLHSHGIPGWFNYWFVEASANFLLFIPVGILAVMVFPRNKWWQDALIGVTASGVMELGQFLFLDRRVSSPKDLVTNTAGTLVGILLAYALKKRLKKQQAQRHP
jgi:glycopeptide antibiotics resistance protein